MNPRIDSFLPNDEPQGSDLNQFKLPEIDLPKGGGAIKGIDDKFEVNTINGTANFSTALPLSPGRNGFTPPLSLNYNSGAGNSAFGIGWQLSIPSIHIKTDKALPKYSTEDIYLLSGSDDLVPFLVKNNQDTWEPVVINENGYRSSRYRPRIESSHSKIEKIEHETYGTYWKITTRDNTVTFFGRNQSARIADPNNPNHIFQWLAEFSYDNKGNWIKYEYKNEDLENVPNSINEQQRLILNSKITNAYLKKVKYGNHEAYYADSQNPYDYADPTAVIGSEEELHFFELVFDYGEHDELMPKPSEEAGLIWDYRPDAFSSYRSGFEVRTNRLCKRILLFHKFEELGPEPCVVKSVQFEYTASNINGSNQSETTYLTSVVHTGYIKRDDGTYSKKSLPPMTFEYQNLVWDNTVQQVSQSELENTPVGLTNNYQWVDLYGEGISGILTEEGDGWYYKQNLGDLEQRGAQFSAVHQVTSRPSPGGINNGISVFQDLEANGEKQLVVNTPEIKGYYGLDSMDVDKMNAGPFTPFQSIPNIDWRDPNTRFIDLNGDGRPELVVSEEDAFLWYENLGKDGYAPGNKNVKSFDENAGPAIAFSDATQGIFLADFSGDGLTDIIRIRNGEVCYWPNLGYGNFGSKINMSNAPHFDFPDAYNPNFLHLADVSGTGATDIIYLGKNSFKAYINLSGNGWSDAHEINPYVSIDNRGKLSVVDLLGTGTSCIVWSSDVPGQHPMRYVDLMSSKKPHIMAGYSNGMGKEVSVSYKNSTYFYLKDKKEGNPWVTKLPFPVQVIEKTSVKDHISASELVTTYSYHHGYYDYEEREFRGFGRIDQIDQESFETYMEEDVLDIPPILTKTWVHTGSFKKQGAFSKQYQNEYYSDDVVSHILPDSIIENSEDFEYPGFREAVRSLKGNTLRQEIYSLDGSVKEDIPYTITETNYKVRLLQYHTENSFGVYQSLPKETLTYTSERNTNDPRIGHQFALAHDEYGHVLQSLQIAYPRRSATTDVHPEQLKMFAIVQEADYENETEAYYRLGLPTAQRHYEINGLQLNADDIFTLENIKVQLGSALEEVNVLSHHEEFSSGLQARLIGATFNHYKNGVLKHLAMLDYIEQLLMNEEWVTWAYDGKVDDNMMQEAGYYKKDGYWYTQSKVYSYLGADEFYLPFKTTDVFGNVSEVAYDPYHLTITDATDALQNTTIAEIDYRTLSIKKMVDINDSVSEAFTDELGLVIATSIYGTEESVQKGDLPIDQYVRVPNPTLNDIVANPLTYLQAATSFYYYHLEQWELGNLPPHYIRVQRETHVSNLEVGQQTSVQISLGYSDGFGRELQSKIKHNENQWIVSGRTIYNNKEKPVKQYEPFFSNTHVFESEEEIGPVGVTPILYYDALGRPIKTETPDGFHSKVEYNPWQVSSYDLNDTVLDSINYTQNSNLPVEDPKKNGTR